jgi:hypothetical protein
LNVCFLVLVINMRSLIATSVVVVAMAETCENGADAMSAIQSQVVRHADKSASQAARLQEAISTTPADAPFICVSAKVGETAPLAGTFTPDGSHATIEVDVGSVADVTGRYCVENSVVALMQRAMSREGLGNVEGAVTDKFGLPSLSGKFTQQVCGGAGAQCKVALKTVGSAHCGEAAAASTDATAAKVLGCSGTAQVIAVCKSGCKLTCKDAVTEYGRVNVKATMCTTFKAAKTTGFGVTSAVAAFNVGIPSDGTKCTESDLVSHCK